MAPLTCRAALVVAALTALAAPAPGADKPLKVFVLAGQSNMQGHANVSTFDSMAGDPKTAALLKEMRGPDGKPRVCEKVWISSVGCLGDAYTDLREKKGQLTAGFGAPENKIGPEFTFGLTMEKHLGEPVLIIKTAWGGRSLHTDFRPPSAGPFVLAKETQKLWDENPKGAHGIPKAEDRPKFHADKVAATGVYYREMIAHTKKVLKDIKRVVPDYDEKRGFELAGFVWFQGFNDYVGFSEYPNREKPGGFDQYADLLAHLIRDVRKDLSAPKLPVVIGVMGIDGLKGDKKGAMMHFREAQRKAVALPEFKGTVFAVETAPFWDDDLEALQERMQRMNGKLDAEFKKNPKLTREEKDAARKKATDAEFKPEELKRLKEGVSNGGYHYLGAAKILAPIGQAFAEALLPAKALPNAARPTGFDYSKIDRTIKAEPVYQTKNPKYALLVFGREAKLRVWVVTDGEALYLDRNGDGDLTGKGERFAKFEDCKNIEIADPDGKTRYVVTSISKYEESETALRVLADVEIRGPLSYQQYSDAGLQGTPAKAPVSHFHGPLAMGPVTLGWKVPPKLAFKTESKPFDFPGMVGTMDAEHGCWVVVRSHTVDRGKDVAAFPAGVFPVVDVEFPSKTPGGPAIKKRYPLDGFC